LVGLVGGANEVRSRLAGDVKLAQPNTTVPDETIFVSSRQTPETYDDQIYTGERGLGKDCAPCRMYKTLDRLKSGAPLIIGGFKISRGGWALTPSRQRSKLVGEL
jgi:hypothetical protein